MTPVEPLRIVNCSGRTGSYLAPLVANRVGFARPVGRERGPVIALAARDMQTGSIEGQSKSRDVLSIRARGREDPR